MRENLSILVSALIQVAFFAVLPFFGLGMLLCGDILGLFIFFHPFLTMPLFFLAEELLSKWELRRMERKARYSLRDFPGSKIEQ